jgi:UbiA prenyltransferase family
MKPSTVLSAQRTDKFMTRGSRLRFACFLLGHHFDNRVSRAGTAGHCHCGEALTQADRTAVHVRHNLACLLSGHTYEKIGERDDHCEYVCESCGHPMLFAIGLSSYSRREHFRKFVRPRCGLGGHPVHIVTTRGGMTEYACDCGHSFLLPQNDLTKVRHPLICLLTGHSIKPFARWGGMREFRCENCGHPFCLTAKPSTTTEAGDELPLRKTIVSNLLRLIRFKYHLTFIGAILGAAFVAKGLPLALVQSLALLYGSFNVLLYGGIYTMNDVLDAESDKQHPLKKQRPLQSGVISRKFAIWFSSTLIMAGLLTGFWLFGGVVVSLYLVMLGVNLFYSLYARQIRWLDIVCNAAPHPLRFLMGAILAGGTVPIGLLTAIFWLAFGIASTRRMLEKDVPGWWVRKVLERYSPRDLFWLRLLPLCALFLQFTFDSSVPKAFYVVILAVYFLIVFGVSFLKPLRQCLVGLWTK